MSTIVDELLLIGIAIDPRGDAEQRVRCPICGKKDLGVNAIDGRFQCFPCGWKGRAGGIADASQRPVIRINDPGIAQRKRERLRKTWREAFALASEKAYPVRRYLEARALGDILKNPPTVLRAHPSLPYWDGARELGRFPAMIALFQSVQGQPVTLHVTYLRTDGCAKAPVPSPKKILGVPVRGATKGGAIRLYAPNDGLLGIAEGIESAFSLGLLQRIPVWASYCADNLQRVRLPSNLRKLYIAADVDRSGKGEQVATKLARRVHAWKPRIDIFICRPEFEGCGDLNDELLRRQA